MSELTERGLKLFSEIRDQDRAATMRARLEREEFGSALSRLATDFVFGSVWAREGLERKQRSLVTIAVLIALGRTEELKNHVRIGLKNGLTITEIEEAILQTAAYAGFPAAWSASNAATDVLQDLELVPKPVPEKRPQV